MYKLYLDSEISVQKGLALKRLITVICDDQDCAETPAIERHAVQQSKLVGPKLSGSFIKVF